MEDKKPFEFADRYGDCYNLQKVYDPSLTLTMVILISKKDKQEAAERFLQYRRKHIEESQKIIHCINCLLMKPKISAAHITNELISGYLCKGCYDEIVKPNSEA